MTVGKDEKDVVWLGDSLSILRGFSRGIRIDLGSDLRRLQIGELPLNSKPMKTVGPGVWELRARDRDNQYRSIYVARMQSRIVVLHIFIKKGRSTARVDINTARERLHAFDRQ